MNPPLNQTEIDITPDPQILYVLTYTSMEPIHSVCELVDNAIDSFRQAPADRKTLVHIELPTSREIREGRGKIRVRDTGPGLSIEQVRNALKAGYTSKKPYGSLGLFGVGFNIATGKLGRTTRFITAREQDNHAIEVTLDLDRLRRQHTFKLQAQTVPKPDGLSHGTVVEVSEPWGEGNQNHGFMRKLVEIGRQKTLQRLGRIYATILRDSNLRIQVGDDTVEPFYHCHWAPHRMVERQKHGQIPAVIEFKNHVVSVARRCMECYSVLADGIERCATPGCGSVSANTVEERISGWVGIQRYMDPSHYGIDLIRNGRLIRPMEKAAFFEFQDPDTGEVIVDYPIDDRQGRIIGEVTLDNVPVDPAKQDFERSSQEWRRAVEFLRGQSSLQPTRPKAVANTSPIYKLYQGYRKVRVPGRHDMYMGKWRVGQQEPSLLTSDEVLELKEKFEAKEPGHFPDDSEWWKFVEASDEKPLDGLKRCPSCSFDCLQDAQECPGCGHLFEGKTCIETSCGSLIPRSAETCPVCGANQISEVFIPWTCVVCGASNRAEQTNCSGCDNSRGTPDPLSHEVLRAISAHADEFSLKNLTIRLASGEFSSPVNVLGFLAPGPLWAYRPEGKKERLPAVRQMHEHDLFVFMDSTHPLFRAARIRLQTIIATEAALYIYEMNRALLSRYPHEHNVTKLMNDILDKGWKAELFLSADQALDRARDLLTAIKDRLAASVGEDSAEVYQGLDRSDKELLAKTLVHNGHDLTAIKEFSENGTFVLFLPFSSLVNVFKSRADLFFDGNVWDVSFSRTGDLELELGLLSTVQGVVRQGYLNALETVLLFSDRKPNDPAECEMAIAAISYLRQKLKR